MERFFTKHAILARFCWKGLYNNSLIYSVSEVAYLEQFHMVDSYIR